MRLTSGERSGCPALEARTISVIVEEENRPVDTGLVDEFGVSIYRVRERVKVGF